MQVNRLLPSQTPEDRSRWSAVLVQVSLCRAYRESGPGFVRASVFRFVRFLRFYASGEGVSSDDCEADKEIVSQSCYP